MFAELYDAGISRKARRGEEDRRMLRLHLSPVLARALSGHHQSRLPAAEGQARDRPIAFNRRRARCIRCSSAAREWDLHPGPNPAGGPRTPRDHVSGFCPAEEYSACSPPLPLQRARSTLGGCLHSTPGPHGRSSVGNSHAASGNRWTSSTPRCGFPTPKTGAKVIPLGAPSACVPRRMPRVSDHVCYGLRRCPARAAAASMATHSRGRGTRRVAPARFATRLRQRWRR